MVAHFILHLQIFVKRPWSERRYCTVGRDNDWLFLDSDPFIAIHLWAAFRLTVQLSRQRMVMNTFEGDRASCLSLIIILTHRCKHNIFYLSVDNSVEQLDLIWCYWQWSKTNCNAVKLTHNVCDIIAPIASYSCHDNKTKSTMFSCAYAGNIIAHDPQWKTLINYRHIHKLVKQ